MIEKEIISQFLGFLKKCLRIYSLEGRYKIVGPFLRPDGDYIEVEAIPQNDGKILLTERGESLDYLYSIGLRMNTEEFKRTLSLIARQNNIELSREELFILTEKEKIGESLYKLINAIFTVCCLSYRKRLTIPRFKQKGIETIVRDFLKKEGIHFIEDYTVEGKLIPHAFRFYVNERKPTLIQPLSPKDEEDALNEAMILGFEWIDIMERHPYYERVVIIDDLGKKEAFWDDRALKVLEAYSAFVGRASNLEELKDFLFSR